MSDQTFEPITDARLRQLRDDEYVCVTDGVRSMAAELLAARARLATLEEQARVHRREYRELHVSCEKHVEKHHEFRVYLAEIGDALGEPEDTRFDALPGVARELRARITEPEVPAAEPHAYIAVQPIHSPNADGPEWFDRAVVFPAGDPYGIREGLLEHGYDLVPIVGTETGTRPAAQSDPVGYVVGWDSLTGDLVVNSTPVPDVESANVLAGHMGISNLSLRVYELREVRGE